MQYWLFNWGSSNCPAGWNKYGPNDCWKNSNYAEVPDFPITDFDSYLQLEVWADAGGEDGVLLDSSTDSYLVTSEDSVLDISSVWNKVEFNVLGDGGGSEAVFNRGTSIQVNVWLADGTNFAPTCLANGGTTTESNNLNLGSCSTSVNGGDPSWIEFTESN